MHLKIGKVSAELHSLQCISVIMLTTHYQLNTTFDEKLFSWNGLMLFGTTYFKTNLSLLHVRFINSHPHSKLSLNLLTQMEGKLPVYDQVGLRFNSE